MAQVSCCVKESHSCESVLITSLSESVFLQHGLLAKAIGAAATVAQPLLPVASDQPNAASWAHAMVPAPASLPSCQHSSVSSQDCALPISLLVHASHSDPHCHLTAPVGTTPPPEPHKLSYFMS